MTRNTPGMLRPPSPGKMHVLLTPAGPHWKHTSCLHLMDKHLSNKQLCIRHWPWIQVSQTLGMQRWVSWWKQNTSSPEQSWMKLWFTHLFTHSFIQHLPGAYYDRLCPRQWGFSRVQKRGSICSHGTHNLVLGEIDNKQIGKITSDDDKCYENK